VRIKECKSLESEERREEKRSRSSEKGVMNVVGLSKRETFRHATL